MMGAVKRSAMTKGSLSRPQEGSYNRFFVNAFTEADIDEIVAKGGASSKEQFKKVSRQHIKERGYWEAMFERKRSMDGKKSDFQRLGDAVYDVYFKGLQKEGVAIREITRRGKTKTFITPRFTVKKGERVSFQGKIFKGGQFLPKNFSLRKGN